MPAGGTGFYAEKVRMAMKTGANVTGQPMTTKELADAIEFSFENVRKVIKGEHLGSREMNEALCRVLNLPEAEMWQIAEREKATKRLGMSVLTSIPRDQRLVEVWPRLLEADKEKIIRIAEGFALAAEAIMAEDPHKPRIRPVRRRA